MTCSSAPSKIAGRAGSADQADAAEVVVRRRPDANRETRSFQRLWDAVRKTRLEVDELANRVQARPIHGIPGAQAFVEDAGEDLDDRAAEPGAAGGADSDP